MIQLKTDHYNELLIETMTRLLPNLKNGLYHKGRSTLQYFNAKTGQREYCCLGIVCDITEGVTWETSKGSNTATAEYGGSENNLLLPSLLARDLGISIFGTLAMDSAWQEDPRWPVGQGVDEHELVTVDLAWLNDEVLTFDFIYDLIDHAMRGDGAVFILNDSAKNLYDYRKDPAL